MFWKSRIRLICKPKKLERKPSFKKNISEETKMRRQKKSHDEQPYTTYMPALESEESAAQRRN